MITQQHLTDAPELFRWMVVARTLGTTLCTLNVRWFPVEGEEAVQSAASSISVQTTRSHRITAIRSWCT